MHDDWRGCGEWGFHKLIVHRVDNQCQPGVRYRVMEIEDAIMHVRLYADRIPDGALARTITVQAQCLELLLLEGLRRGFAPAGGTGVAATVQDAVERAMALLSSEALSQGLTNLAVAIQEDL